MLFRDLGIPVDAVESRTAAVCTNKQGESRIVIAAKGFLLSVDPITKQCQQASFPDGFSDYPFLCFSSSQGIFYTGAGPMFYAYDPFKNQYIEALEVGTKDEICGFSFAEDQAGHIYFASYPRCQLYCYQPERHKLQSFGSLDAKQKYPSHLAIDSDGYIYMGIGTVKKDVIVYDPKHSRKHSLFEKKDHRTGMGIVRQGPDQQVYVQDVVFPEQWMYAERGAIVQELSAHEVPVSLYSGTSFQRIHRQLSGDWHIINHSLSDGELHLQHQTTKQVKIIALPYSSEGANLSPLVLGPRGIIYGTSNHPLHMFSYDAEKDRLKNWGPQVIEGGSGGNICAYALQGDTLAGAVYAGGSLHLLDTLKPIQLNDADSRNPLAVTQHSAIHRPRCALALADGEQVVYGGFPGYGEVGGGLCFYNIRSHEEQLLTHEQIVPFQSTVSITEDRNGNLVGGTSIETPGGAEPKASSACIYVLDGKTCRILKQWEPDPLIREYSLLFVDDKGLIHSISSSSIYIVWDPIEEVEVYRQDVSQWGDIVRQGWVYDQASRRIIVVLSEALFTINPLNFEIKLLDRAPQHITSGLALYQNRIYYGSGSHLWSYRLSNS